MQENYQKLCLGICTALFKHFNKSVKTISFCKNSVSVNIKIYLLQFQFQMGITFHYEV